jgi:hypothetical protein
MHVEVVAPFGDLVGAVGQSINHGHWEFLLRQDSCEYRLRPDGPITHPLLTALLAVRQVPAAIPSPWTLS